MQTRNAIQLAFYLSCLCLSSLAVAANKDHRCSPYVIDSNKQFVRDGIGHCVRASHWTASDFLASCEGKSASVIVPAMKITQDEAKKTVTMSAGALFDVNSSEIKPDSRSQLHELKNYVDNLSDVQSIEIVGHTDSTGSDEYNQSLSQRRATAVKNYLVEQGMNTNTISTVGVGESRPIADNNTTEGRARNRRVEVHLKGSK
ncbi:MAG: OmpA family protein [Gammaproteobacteria bacterium]|nr:OmpA family protein [Gammaproteobacteria bacterium]